MNPRGNKRAPKHTERFICAKAGSPTRREAHGDGTPIGDFRGTMPFLEIKGAAHEDGEDAYDRYPYTGKVSGSYERKEVCEMQTTESLLGLLRERGKRGLPLTRVYRQLYGIVNLEAWLNHVLK
jgi:hypothetical protein